MPPAIVVPKEMASQIIALLKSSQMINENFKIEQIEDEVYIPVVDLDKTMLPRQSDIRLTNHDFAAKEYRPSSLSEALMKLAPKLDRSIIQTSYDQIGDIAIIDLNDELLPYKEKVGEAILWSNTSVRSVFRKSSKVKGLLRLRELELIAGEYSTKTVHKEHGIKIIVDVDKAYFSPRLATEHRRIAELIAEGRVLDMFGSLAPFGLHITKSKEIIVDSVDINPNVPELIRSSVAFNNLQGEINPITMDAHQYASQCQYRYDWIIMNHPSGAIDFLEDAIRLGMPQATIFYYDFVPIDHYIDFIHSRLDKYERIMILDIHIVRQSSPSEYHVCVQLSIK